MSAFTCAFSLHLSHTPTICLCQVVAALRNVGFDDQKLKSEFAPQEFENFSSITSYRSQKKYVKRAQNLLGILKPFISEGVSILHVDSNKTPLFCSMSEMVAITWSTQIVDKCTKLLVVWERGSGISLEDGR